MCLCGSTRFKAAFEEAARSETLAGRVVLSVGVFGHQEASPLPDHVKVELDRLHLEKIDLADEVLVEIGCTSVSSTSQRNSGLPQSSSLAISLRAVPITCDRVKYSS